jgi:hypothetical protein
MGASRKACRSVAGQIQAVAVPREQCPVNVLLAHGYGRATRCMCAPCGNFKAPHSAPVTVTHSTAPPAKKGTRLACMHAAGCAAVLQGDVYAQEHAFRTLCPAGACAADLLHVPC